MALTKTTRIANRFGLNLVFHYLADGTDHDNDITLDYANQVTIEVTGDAVYATGEQGHKNLVGFNNPIEGTMTISTQILTPQILKLLAGDTSSAVATAVFKSREDMPFYSITGETVWKGEDGTVYDEAITVHKCLIRPNYSATYSGDGDPHSIDLNIELMEDTNGMITFAQSVHSTTT